MKLNFGLVGRLALLGRLLTIVLGTKDSSVLNHVADGLDRAQKAVEVLQGKST